MGKRLLNLILCHTEMMTDCNCGKRIVYGKASRDIDFHIEVLQPLHMIAHAKRTMLLLQFYILCHKIIGRILQSGIEISALLQVK